MSIITYTDFEGAQSVAGLSNFATRQSLQVFIDEYEPLFIAALLGYALADEFLLAIKDVNWDLIGLNTEPHAYTDEDIDPVTGNIHVFSVDVAPERRLLSVYAGSTQVIGVGYDIATGDVSGLGGYIDIPTAFTMTFVVPNTTQTGDVFQDPIASEIDPKWVALRDNASLKKMIVCYVYYWYTRNEATLTAVTGEVKPKNENSTSVSSAQKQADAWNKMSRMARAFTIDVSVYPSYVYPNWNRYSYWFCDCQVNEIYYTINTRNI